MRDWLPENHLVWFVIDVVEQPDLAEFRRAHRADGHGRAAYDPAIVVALLLYAYRRSLLDANRTLAALRKQIDAILAEAKPPIQPPGGGAPARPANATNAQPERADSRTTSPL